MKIRELAQHWEENAKGRLTKTEYAIHLDVEAAARLAAIAEMYPKRHPEELLGELIGAALEELEASFPYIKGQHVIATDEEGDPLYEDVGPYPALSHLVTALPARYGCRRRQTQALIKPRHTLLRRALVKARRTAAPAESSKFLR